MKRLFNIIIMLLIFGTALQAKEQQDVHLTVVITGNVHNVTKGIWYDTITNAIAEASNNNLIEVYPGTYNESINISGFTNLTLRAWGWTNAQDNTNTKIVGSGESRVVSLSNSKKVTILGFSITGATNGVYITGTAVSNYITHNNIYSNTSYGIQIDSGTANNNFIFTNNIWGKSQGYGIYVNGGDYTTIKSNKIHNNFWEGINITGSSTNNYIIKNSIYSNGKIGIRVWGSAADNNFILTNNIFKSQDYGISIENGDFSHIEKNVLSDNTTNGVYITGSTNTIVRYNKIYNNLNGLKVQSSKCSVLSLNTIISNNIGIVVTDSVLSNFTKNNIFTNTTLNFETLSPGNLVVTNNWWGTTILSGIRSKVSGVSNTNLIPYRLFGEFDITPGADVDRLPAISFVTAVGSSSNITITWTKPADIGDLVRYFVYRSTNAGYTNLSYVDVRTQMSGVNSTNLVDIPPKAGTYYYYITSLDDATPFGTIYTNESWYSVEASASMGSISIFVTNTNLFYTNIPLNFTTASQTTYISNDGSLPCKVIGQVNDFTNNYYASPLVWDVTNVGTPGNDEIKVEIKTSPNGFIPNWTAVVNQEQIFTIDDNLPVGDVVYLYIRITTPLTTSSTKAYRSRVKATAQAP